MNFREFRVSPGYIIVFKTILYFLIAFLAPVVDTLSVTAKYDYWPSWPQVVLSLILGVSSGLIALKAFFDGSMEQYKMKVEEEKRLKVNNTNNEKV